jgi:endonuclease/exonuclease/phosphatase family metal-dependent hydrolase
MKRFVSLTILLTCVTLCASLAAGQTASTPATTSSAPASSPATATSQPQPFVMATYNINYGRTDAKSLDAIVDLIKKSEADLIAVQETTEASALHFRKTLSKLYPHMAFQEGQAAGGLGILSRSAIVQKNYIPPVPNGGWFGTLIAQTQVGGKNVLVADVHLRAAVPQGKEGIRQFTDLFLQTEEIRTREIKNILQEIAKLNKANDPVILLGDFNSPSKFSAPSILCRSGYFDSAASLDPKADKQTTWQWVWQGMPYSFRLDYIFHGKQVRTLECRVLAGGPSDHNPVVSKLQWADRLPAGPTTRVAQGLPMNMPAPKTLAEALAAPESMAAGLRSGMPRKDFKGQEVRWRLMMLEITQEDGSPLMKAQSASGFLVTCKMPESARNALAKLKADDWVEVAGKISDFEYEKPQETTDMFQAKSESLGVLLEADTVKKVQAAP